MLGSTAIIPSSVVLSLTIPDHTIDDDDEVPDDDGYDDDDDDDNDDDDNNYDDDDDDDNIDCGIFAGVAPTLSDQEGEDNYVIF